MLSLKMIEKTEVESNNYKVSINIKTKAEAFSMVMLCDCLIHEILIVVGNNGRSKELLFVRKLRDCFLTKNLILQMQKNGTYRDPSDPNKNDFKKSNRRN